MVCPKKRRLYVCGGYVVIKFKRMTIIVRKLYTRKETYHLYKNKQKEGGSKSVKMERKIKI